MDQSNGVATGKGARDPNTTPTKNLIDTAIAAGNLTAFVAALKSTGLINALVARGPFTVFAPNDEAFKKLPSGSHDALLKDLAKFKAVLNYHVIAGHFYAGDLKTGDVVTLQGRTFTAAVSPSEIRINGAHVTDADLVATNGVVHIIDTVILPKNWQLLAVVA
jgi:uncharacterized surface protein with fasciclin (FAS1) repeats